MAATPGQRVYMVRLALGDGVKNPLSLAAFAALIKKKAHKTFDPSALSRLENGKREMTVLDAVAIAKVDPLNRGPNWLAFDPPMVLDLSHAKPVSEAAQQRAEAITARGSVKAPAKAKRPKKRRDASGGA